MSEAARRIAVGDIGGTHARFAMAELPPVGHSAPAPPIVGSPRVYDTAAHADLASAWRTFVRDSGVEADEFAGVAIAVAGPADADVVKLTNSPWTIDRADLARSLGAREALLINDFGAMAWGLSALPATDLVHVAGPDAPLPAEGIVSVIGPGTGLGVAQLIRREDRVLVVECEGGHAGFAPADPMEDALVEILRARHGRVSIERLVSGPGLAVFRQALAPDAVGDADPAELWRAALDGDDPAGAEALARLALAYGAAAGDFALVHGAAGVALTGDLTGRMLGVLRAGGFFERFTAKGRHGARMARLPVRWVSHEQAGLLGAAVAFQARDQEA